MSQILAQGYETIIGLEIHVQLLTNSKMFCGCSIAFGAPPNTQVCPVCLGLPGSLPVINRAAVEMGLRTAVALGCEVHAASQFHRKNYYYPDLPKNYQISQYQYKVHPPLATNGTLELTVEEGVRRIRIRRVHLEEDTGKLVHVEHANRVVYTLIDYNRSGVPLMEVVTDPDLRSPEEARVFLGRLRALLQAIGVSSGRMEEGTLRCDANVSLHRPGQEFGIRTEVKNMNSLRSVERALAFESERQRALLERGEAILQETRHWDEDRQVTFPSRSKEEAQDYRYFPEPDLVPIAIVPDQLETIRATLPELPEARVRRFQEVYRLSVAEAELIISSGAMGKFFEETVAVFPHPKTVSSWLTGEVAGFLHAQGKDLEDLPVSPRHLAELLELIEQGAISGRSAKEVLQEMLATGARPQAIVQQRGLGQISDREALLRVIDEVISAHPGPAADYRAGKVQVLTFLIGQVMARTRGRANPELANTLLRERLSQ